MTAKAHCESRPAGFDAALVAYIPSLRKQATYMAGNREDGEELLQEALDTMLRRAGGCRVETFRVWAQMRLRGVASLMKRAAMAEKRSGMLVDIDKVAVGTAPAQEHAVDLATAVSALDAIPHGDIVLRRAAGALLREIGEERGTTREDIRQKEVRALAALNKRMAV
jgi:DNA-directed RNA polymerase specialized sigma24 family protein